MLSFNFLEKDLGLVSPRKHSLMTIVYYSLHFLSSANKAYCFVNKYSDVHLWHEYCLRIVVKLVMNGAYEQKFQREYL